MAGLEEQPVQRASTAAMEATVIQLQPMSRAVVLGAEAAVLEMSLERLELAQEVVGATAVSMEEEEGEVEVQPTVPTAAQVGPAAKGS